MRNYLKKLNLWQQKRNSLPIPDDAQVDWAAMEAILNREMPQTEDDKHIILLSPPKKLNLLSIMLLSFSAAAMTLVVTHSVKTYHRQQSENHHIHHKKHHKFFDNSDLDTLNNSLVNNNDTVTFDSVVLKSYLFINATEGKGDVKNENITNNIAHTYIASPLISFWQKYADINPQYNLKALTVADQKKIATTATSNKVIDNDVPLPLFSNEWLNIGVKKITNKPVKQLINGNKTVDDSLTHATSNSVKEHSNTASGNLVSATNKTKNNSVKNNIGSISSPIKTSPLAIAGVSATASISNLSANSGRATNHKKEGNLALNKVSKHKNAPNKANAVIDTIATSLKTQNGDDDTVNSSYTAKTSNALVKNNKNNAAKNLQKNSVLGSPPKTPNNLISTKPTNIAKPKIDSVALMAKSENKPDDSVISNHAIKTSSPIAKNNKNQANKKGKSTISAGGAAYYSNRFAVKNLKFNASKAINNAIGQNNTADSSTTDSIIKPNMKAYAALQNKNSRPNKVNKTRKSLNKTKNKTGIVTSSAEEEDSQLVANEPIIIASVTKKVENEIVVPDLMSYGHPTTFYIELAKLNPIGKPTVVNLVNDNSSMEEVTDEDMETENKKLAIFTLLDYGMLFGLNNPDSFYSYNQGSNSNGSLPVSPFFGIFVNLNLHNRWSISSQIRFMVPRNNAIDYSFSRQLAIDSIQQLKVNNTRKIYTLDIPLHLVYKVNKNISFYGGPTISIPLMQINVNNRLQTDTIKAGIATYSAYSNVADNSPFSRKLSFGISAGAKYQFDRYNIGFMWDKNFCGYQINSIYGTSYSKLSSFQVTFGISLKKPKSK